MSDPTAPDLLVLVRRAHEASSEGDLDVMMGVYGPDAILVTERFGRFEGRAAIRAYYEDWLGSFDDLMVELELHDHGNGVVFVGQVLTGRHASSSSEIHMRNAAVHEFVDGLIVRSTTYMDIDEARAVAERVATEPS
jgi:ketosteroid isomerase-like protein